MDSRLPGSLLQDHSQQHAVGHQHQHRVNAQKDPQAHRRDGGPGIIKKDQAKGG